MASKKRISWIVDTDNLDCQGHPIKTGLTYELARKMVPLPLSLQPSRGSANIDVQSRT